MRVIRHFLAHALAPLPERRARMIKTSPNIHALHDSNIIQPFGWDTQVETLPCCAWNVGGRRMFGMRYHFASWYVLPLHFLVGVTTSLLGPSDHSGRLDWLNQAQVGAAFDATACGQVDVHPGERQLQRPC